MKQVSDGRILWRIIPIFREVDQEELMSPTIFNVVVDAVVRHCVSLVVEGAEGPDGRGVEVLICTLLLYADDILIASTNPVWMQRAFLILTGLFDRVGIQINVLNMKGMLYRPCHAVGTHLEEAYKRRMTGAGLTYRDRHRLRVQLPE